MYSLPAALLLPLVLPAAARRGLLAGSLVPRDNQQGLVNQFVSVNGDSALPGDWMQGAAAAVRPRSSFQVAG